MHIQRAVVPTGGRGFLVFKHGKACRTGIRPDDPAEEASRRRVDTGRRCDPLTPSDIVGCNIHRQRREPARIDATAAIERRFVTDLIRVQQIKVGCVRVF
jgi:hypothetical protein